MSDALIEEYMTEFANIRNSSFSSCSELTIPLGGALTVVAGTVMDMLVDAVGYAYTSALSVGRSVG